MYRKLAKLIVKITAPVPEIGLGCAIRGPLSHSWPSRRRNRKSQPAYCSASGVEWPPHHEESIMPIIARFSIDVPFGKKGEMLKVFKKWEAMETELGFPKGQVLIGSIGAPESRVEVNYRFESLAALDAVWSRLNDPRIGEYQRDIAPFVIPGSHRWDVLRIQDE
jgi:hypothetical protein